MASKSEQIAALTARYAALRGEVFDLRSREEGVKPHLIGKKRRQCARILTQLAKERSKGEDATSS